MGFWRFWGILRWALYCANRRVRRYLAIHSTGSKLALIMLFILLRIFIDFAIPIAYNESITNEGETTMNIIVKTPAALETEAFLLANIHRGPVRERVYKPFEYEPYESEREIIAERLAEMGLK